MKLSEIIKIVSQPVPGFDLSKIEVFNTVKENYLGKYTVKLGKFQDQYAFTVLDNDVIIASLITVEIDDLDLSKTALIVKRTWCNREYRNRGIITNLYRLLYNELGYALVSDIEQSPETIRVWDKLRSAWNVKMIDMKTKEITDINTTELYGDPNKALIVESAMKKNNFSGIIIDHVFGLTED